MSVPERPAAPLRTLVVDDEALARDLLATLIRRDAELEWVGESRDGASALRDVRRLRPDLLLLDVQMPALNGLEVLERLIAEDGEPPQTVLVTAHDEHAIRAFELEALDYLVKPIEKARFARSMARAKQAVRNRELLSLTRRMVTLSRSLEEAREEASPEKEVLIRRGDELISVPPDEIVWVEAANQYSNVHTLRGSFLVAEPLAAYERRLRGPEFVRVHRSALINARRARRILRRGGGTHEVVMDGGTRIPLARSRRALLPGLLRQVRGGEP